MDFIQFKLGHDAEFFVSSGGIAKESSALLGADESMIMPTRKLAIKKDGFQVEFNPPPRDCRETMCYDIQHTLRDLHRTVQDKGLDVSFESSVIIKKEDFDNMPEDSDAKIFGCDPSFSAYKDGSEIKIKVDPKKDRKRTAGGHLHFGFYGTTVKINNGLYEECRGCEELKFGCGRNHTFSIDLGNDIRTFINGNDKDRKMLISKLSSEKLNKDYKYEIGTPYGITDALLDPITTIPMIDLLCGIPSILIDRDKNAKSRRLVYGQAGDYRTPPHGLEYRTLSNFWLKSPVLLFFVFGMARQAILIVAEQKKNGKDLCSEFWKRVNKKDVAKAINNNDFVMARNIFLKIEDLIIKYATNTDNFPINKKTLIPFKYFIINGGMKTYFKKDIFTEWEDKFGWERWIVDIYKYCGMSESAVTKQFKTYEG